MLLVVVLMVAVSIILWCGGGTGLALLVVVVLFMVVRIMMVRVVVVLVVAVLLLVVLIVVVLIVMAPVVMVLVVVVLVVVVQVVVVLVVVVLIIGFSAHFSTVTVLRTRSGWDRTQASADSGCFWACSRHGVQTSSVNLPQEGGP